MPARITGLNAAASATLAAFLLAAPSAARAHRDTMDGPVVTAARSALKSGDVTATLRWVRAGDEPAIRKAFAQTLSVRKLAPEASALADEYFFETLVRIHRAGEGVPYEGLKPAGSVEPGIVLADAALVTGSSDHLLDALIRDVSRGVRERFTLALEARKHEEESVAAGRESVAAYVSFIHYVEALHEAAQGAGGHDDSEEDPATARGGK